MYFWLLIILLFFCHLLAKTFTEMPNLTELCEIVIYWLVRLDTFHVLGHKKKKKKSKMGKKTKQNKPPPQKKNIHIWKLKVIKRGVYAVVWMVSLLQFF